MVACLYFSLWSCFYQLISGVAWRSCLKVFHEKSVLKNFQKIHRKTLAMKTFIKVKPKPAILVKIVSIIAIFPKPFQFFFFIKAVLKILVGGLLSQILMTRKNDSACRFLMLSQCFCLEILMVILWFRDLNVVVFWLQYLKINIIILFSMAWFSFQSVCKTHVNLLHSL